MYRRTALTNLARQVNQLITVRAQPLSSSYSTVLHSPITPQQKEGTVESGKDKTGQKNVNGNPHHKEARTRTQRHIGEDVSRRDKINILVTTLIDLPDSKEAVYSTLDTWVAFEQDFPIGSLKNVLIALEKKHQWHKVIQVIKWMLSKGQGMTRGTYGQLIQALDMDRRAEEANEIWKKKLGYDLHSVPWKLCKLMISVYYRNNMIEDVVKLFKGLEGFDRKPPEKSIVGKVANAYEMMGLPEEKERVMEKYKNLFVESGKGKFQNPKGAHSPKKKGFGGKL